MTNMIALGCIMTMKKIIFIIQITCLTYPSFPFLLLLFKERGRDEEDDDDNEGDNNEDDGKKKKRKEKTKVTNRSHSFSPVFSFF